MKRLEDYFMPGFRFSWIHDGWVVVTTPYLNSSNDYFQICIKEQGDWFYVTDEGHLSYEMLLSNLKDELEKRVRERFSNLCVYPVDDSFLLKAPRAEFQVRIHQYLEALIWADTFIAEQKTRHMRRGYEKEIQPVIFTYAFT